MAAGKIADDPSVVENVFSRNIRRKFEIFSYRNAASILANGFSAQFAHLVDALERFAITRRMIRLPGGNKGPIAHYVDNLFPSPEWMETHITADLMVRLLDAKPRDKHKVLDQYTLEGFLDGHRIDFVSGRIALEMEWNSKDQTYDRDLYAFSAFYAAGAIDAGIILTRGSSLDNAFFRSLGKVLTEDGIEGTNDVYKKFGASTTWMGQLLPRLDASRNGGCPILAIGITPRCVDGNDS